MIPDGPHREHFLCQMLKMMKGMTSEKAVARATSKSTASFWEGGGYKGDGRMGVVLNGGGVAILETSAGKGAFGLVVWVYFEYTHQRRHKNITVSSQIYPICWPSSSSSCFSQIFWLRIYRLHLKPRCTARVDISKNGKVNTPCPGSYFRINPKCFEQKECLICYFRWTSWGEDVVRYVNLCRRTLSFWDGICLL
jgi:hypothetical protein